MSDPKAAEENLKVIRELMERATTYRALLTLPAIIGCVLTLVVGGWMVSAGKDLSLNQFVFIWLGVFLAVDAANSILIFRESRRRGTEFPSPQTMHGAFAMLPGLLAGGVVGIILALVNEDPVRCALMWAVFAGLSLLSTKSFAPRSIVGLGWTILIAGLGIFSWKELGGFLPGDNSVSQASLVMILTFGGPLALYAMWTGVVSKKSSDPHV